MNKEASMLALACILTLTAFPFELVHANFTPLPPLPSPIYIRSDGSIDPPNAPIQQVGKTYILTDSINNTIEIQSSDIVVNGNGFAVTNPSVNTEQLMIPIGWLPGIKIFDVNNVTVVNMTLKNCITGIRVENASNIIIHQNAFEGGTDAIVVFSSVGVIIENNSIRSSGTGIHFLPSNPNAQDSYSIKIDQNVIFGAGNGISGEFMNSQIIRNNLTSIYGTALNYGGSNSFVADNIFEFSGYGIRFDYQLSANNTIFRNDFSRNSKNVMIPFIGEFPVNHWDNGTVGNYWSDYNGTDTNGDGIGDAPYILSTTYYNYGLGKNVTLERGRDNCPLMNPINGANVPPEPSQSPSPTAPPTQSASPVLTPTPSPSPTEQPTLTLTNSPISTPASASSPSPTQQATTEPVQTASPVAERNQDDNFGQTTILLVLLIAPFVTGTVLYFVKRKRDRLTAGNQFAT